MESWNPTTSPTRGATVPLPPSQAPTDHEAPTLELGTVPPQSTASEETFRQSTLLFRLAEGAFSAITTEAYNTLVTSAKRGSRYGVGSLDEYTLCNQSFADCVTGFDVILNGSQSDEDKANGTDDDSRTLPHATLEVVLICIVVAFLAIMTAGGNLLVIVAFRMDKTLQTVSNYFLLSLAVADLTIGVVSMPLYTLYLLVGYWPLGASMCDIWLALDYTMSNASVANLIIISFDRYLSVTRPLTYRVKRTPRRAGVMICTAWIISVLLWTPWIFAWPYIEGQRNVPDTECYIQFLKTNRYMSIFTAMAAFYVPVSIMFAIYYRIYRTTRRRQKDLPKLQGISKKDEMGGSKKSNIVSSDDEERGKRGQSSPELEDIEAFQAHISRSTSFKSRLLLCLRIDRDSDYVEESSTSDPSASPASSNAVTTASVTGSVYRPNGPGSSFHSHSVCKNNNVTTVSYVVTPQVCSSTSMIPLLPVESPQPSPTLSPCSPPALSPCSPDTELTTSFSRSSRITVNTPLLESDREIGTLDEETEDEEEEDRERSRRKEKDNGMYTVVIELPGDNTHGDALDGKGDAVAEREGRCKPSIRMTADSDLDSFGDLNPDLVQKDPDSDDSVPAVRPNLQQHPRNSHPHHRGEGNDAEHSDDGSNASDTEHHPAQPPVRPPTGTPALARRAHSNDSNKVAQQVKMATKVAVRVRKQRARSKVAWRRQERKQDQKAAKTLTAILLAFIITWTPYNIFTLVETFCSGCINETLYAIGMPL